MEQMNNQSDFYEFPSRPERPVKEPNNMAKVSLLLGLLGLTVSCSCALFPGAIVLGVASVATAIYSKKGQPFRISAILGIIFGILSLIIGVVEFLYLVMLTTAMKDPAYTPFFNQLFEQLEQAGYFDMLEQL